MAEQVTFIEATRDFFETGPLGRKVTIPEFKELSTQDKRELREMLIGQGYDVREFPPPRSEAA